MPKKQQVQIGSRVVVKFEDGFQETFCVAHSGQANIAEKRISNESPLGQAILGQRAKEKIFYNGPHGKKISCEILKVK